MVRNSQQIRVVFFTFSTSNHNYSHTRLLAVLVVFFTFSTSNHNRLYVNQKLQSVVFFTFSTSNHNPPASCSLPSVVVFFTFSTSNHNIAIVYNWTKKLYSLRFLHQTTTSVHSVKESMGCILYVFYIKPQQMWDVIKKADVVFFTFSTSNHNLCESTFYKTVNYDMISQYEVA